MSSKAAWVSTEPLDTEALSRMSIELGPAVLAMDVNDRASAMGLAIEATYVFQQMHYSFDAIYWDARDFPETLGNFARGVIEALKAEPEWLNDRYALVKESLSDLLARHPELVEP